MKLDEMRVGELLEGIASKTPTPGGGAVAALVGALGAALGHMVVAYSKGKKKLRDHDALHDEADARLETLRRRAVDLARADEVAYGRLNELWRLDPADPRRVEQMPAAVREAIEVPRRVLALGEEILDLAERLVGASNAMLASDLAISGVLAEAAARAAAWNVRINTPMLEDRSEAERSERETDEAVDRVATRCARIEAACRGDGAP